LHDGVVQDLAGVAYELAGSARQRGLPAGTASLLEDSAEHVRESIKSLRSLLVDIYPPKLAEAGLPAALGDLLAGAASRGLTTHCDVDGATDDIPDAAAALLFRAAQELTRNVLTHAQATRIDVTLVTSDGMAELVVTDDGVGFTPETAAARAEEGHLGLRGLRDLLAEAGGEVHFDSTPGVGTRARVKVPLR
jgi:signal transduction histidine kinase